MTDTRDEWLGPDIDGTRIAHLTGTPDGLNGTAVLGAATVTNDANKDSLTGGLGADWFLTSASDVVKDLAVGTETRTPV